MFDVPTKPATNSFTGRSADRARRPDLHDAPVIEDRDAVAHRQRFLLVVGDVRKVMPTSAWMRLSRIASPGGA
jgi:hypothetical protein